MLVYEQSIAHHTKCNIYLKFDDGNGPNLCRVKKLDISYTFIENIFRSGLTLVNS